MAKDPYANNGGVIMTLHSHRNITKTGAYYNMVFENTYSADINKVFIPHRSLLEMELLITFLLTKHNYKTLSSLPFASLDLDFISRELQIPEGSVFHTILARFNQNIQSIIPISSYMRKVEEHTRFGNVNAYSKSRIPVFYAMDRLKIKLLVLLNFLTKLESHHYLLASFPKYRQLSDKNFMSVFFSEYFTRMREYFETVTWEPEYKLKFMKDQSQINYQLLNELHKFQVPTTELDVIYIMRSIRASFLVCKIVFQRMDVADPFHTDKGSIDTLILNHEIIPGMISMIDNAYRLQDQPKIREIVSLFINYLTNMLNGIWMGYKIASNDQIHLDMDKTLYYSGKTTIF